VSAWLAAAGLAAAVAVLLPPAAAQRLARSGIGSVAGPRAGKPGAAWWVAAFVAGTAVVAMGAPLPLAVVGGAALVAGRRWRKARALGAARRAREAATIEVTFALAGELHAGRTPSEALAAAATSAGPLSDPLRAAAAAVAVGAGAATELDAAALLPGAERLRAVASAWRVTESAGGRIALVLERLGEAMDHDTAMRRELAAALAAPQATMTLLAGLPVFGIGLGEAIGAHPLRLLVYRPVGWALFGAAAILDLLGILATRAISRWALRC
jgi:tight adherence protein B